MPTEMLMVDALTPPEGMDGIGVLRVLVDRGDVVLVLEQDDETVAGFYEANESEHADLLNVPPEFRWAKAASLGQGRLHNRGDSRNRELKLEDVLPSHLREQVPSLSEMMGAPEDAAV